MYQDGPEDGLELPPKEEEGCSHSRTIMYIMNSSCVQRIYGLEMTLKKHSR